MNSECFVFRKHQGLENIPGGAIFENERIYISHAQLWGNETKHYLGHIFVEPKRHVPQLSDLTKAESETIGYYISMLARALKKVLRVAHVYSFVIGDHIPHVHVHVIGRYPGALREYWGMKVDEWPDAPQGTPEEIGGVVARIREYLKSTILDSGDGF
jgi:diadenosine tetraphosphate (Ap4A) HIT family hydrolase